MDEDWQKILDELMEKAILRYYQGERNEESIGEIDVEADEDNH